MYGDEGASEHPANSERHSSINVQICYVQQLLTSQSLKYDSMRKWRENEKINPKLSTGEKTN